jgi:hypothetical protein
VPGVGFEPTCPCGQSGLSRLRLTVFRHPGLADASSRSILFACEHMFVHCIEDVHRALALHAAGLSAHGVSRQTGVARSTIQHWIRDPDRALRRGQARKAVRPARAPATYAYLLGLYLGDGWMRRYPRTWQLVLTLDSRYESIVDEAREAMRIFTPSGLVRVRRRGDSRAVDVSAYGKHWLTLFPQHGPGRKHLRRIVFVDWQHDITHAHPRHLLRGLIQSDGCRIVASVPGPQGKRYSYPRYYFSNRSADIRAILCEHLDLLAIEWTRSMPHVIQIARRPAVKALDGFIGPKR